MSSSFIAAVIAPLARRKQKERASSSDPELGSLSRRPLLPNIVTEGSPTSPGPASSAATIVPTRHRSPPSYGATNREGPERLSPERVRRDTNTLNRVPEDGTVEFDQGSLDAEEDQELEEELEEELALEERGLYKGSYKRLVLLYSLCTILTLLLVTVLLALLPAFVYYPNRTRPSPYPYAPYLPYPLPEILVSASFWSLSYFLRIPIYSLFAFVSQSDASTILSTTVQTAVATGLRLMTIPILLIPHHMIYSIPTWHDFAFGRVWWAALGWAIAENLVGIKQGYDAIGLYRDVLVMVKKGKTTTTAIDNKDGPLQASQSSSLTGPFEERDGHDEQDSSRETSRPALHLNLEDSLQIQIDRDFEQLMALKDREELEEIYGLPIIRIPIFISCLQRVNSLLLALGLTLLLSAAYIRSSISVPASRDPVMPSHISLTQRLDNLFVFAFPSEKSNQSFQITLPVVFLIQLFLNTLHTPLLLPRIGVHTVVYIALLVSLGSFFAGLGVWHALT